VIGQPGKCSHWVAEDGVAYSPYFRLGPVESESANQRGHIAKVFHALCGANHASHGKKSAL